MTSQLKGTGVALITPFTADGQVDTKALANIVNYVIDGGVEFIVVLGTTSEAPTLTKEEKKIVSASFSEAEEEHKDGTYQCLHFQAESKYASPLVNT